MVVYFDSFGLYIEYTPHESIAYLEYKMVILLCLDFIVLLS